MLNIILSHYFSSLKNIAITVSYSLSLLVYVFFHLILQCTLATNMPTKKRVNLSRKTAAAMRRNANALSLKLAFQLSQNTSHIAFRSSIGFHQLHWLPLQITLHINRQRLGTTHGQGFVAFPPNRFKIHLPTSFLLIERNILSTTGFQFLA